jgi:serine/threonine protein kinase
VPEENLVSRSVAGYALERKVGEGGTSSVYRATHPVHGVVAVKVLRDRLRTDRTAIARFLREARLGERVSHPNVVRTIEVGEDETGCHFLAIEWAPGDLLERYAKRLGPLPIDEVATIVGQIGEAVDAVHQAGIVHRDLKPENLMYDPTSRMVKLLDFGIAAETDASDERLTRAGHFVGTLMYVAPEALSGELVGPAADQYSLATIAYFLTSGTLPFTAKTPREMFSQLLSQDPIPLSRARTGVAVNEEVEAVVMRGLQKSPAARFSDVLAFTAAFRAAAQNAAVPVVAKEEKGWFGRFFRKD